MRDEVLFFHGSVSQATWIPLLILQLSSVTITCLHNIFVPQLLIKRDCSFLLYCNEDNKSQNYFEIPGCKHLCKSKMYHYVLLENKNLFLIVHCLSNQFLAGIQIKITAFHII